MFLGLNKRHITISQCSHNTQAKSDCSQPWRRPSSPAATQQDRKIVATTKLKFHRYTAIPAKNARHPGLRHLSHSVNGSNICSLYRQLYKSAGFNEPYSSLVFKLKLEPNTSLHFPTSKRNLAPLLPAAYLE